MERKLIKSRLNSSSLIFSCIQFRAWAICVRLKIEDNAPDCSVDVEDERLWLNLSKTFQYTGVNKRLVSQGISFTFLEDMKFC